MLFLFSITWGSVSGWWMPACLVLGLLYAWLQYRSPINLSKSFRISLFVARTIAVFIISALLVSPLVRSVNYDPQKPLILVVQDNSESIKAFQPAGFNTTEYVNSLSKLKHSLGNDYDVHEIHFNHELADGLTQTFTGKQTDISTALRQLNERFANQNVGALILATDGLYNQGSDPQYEARNIKSAIYTVALGDTTPRRDLLIANINYNKTAFLGNDFIVEVLVEGYASMGETIHLSVNEGNRQMSLQNIRVSTNHFQKVVPVKLHADKKGMLKFNINIAPVKNEISTENNSETIYVDVLDARQKVLLLYDSPHPDISTIRQSIESNKNYEVKTSLLQDASLLKIDEYSLVMLYQIPGSIGGQLLNTISKSKIPAWFVVGAQTNLQEFNAVQKVVKINASRQELQEVFAQPASGFSAFTLSDSAKLKLNRFPPVLAPFGNYGATIPGSVLLNQRIGSIATNYPLLLFADESGKRTAVLTGEGLWRWQLAEYQNYGNHHALEELFSQGVQYLTANANRQRFRVYTAKNVFDEGENVLLNAELYNDALELINTPDVKIELLSEKGKHYSFLFTRTGKSYQLNAGSLPAGEYTYSATTQNGPKQFKTNGQITVKPLNLETRQSAADHKMLRNIALQSGGQMLLPNQMNELANLIRKNENVKTVVYEDKHYNDLVDVKWVFVIITLLLSVEWFMRKREGEV